MNGKKFEEVFLGILQTRCDGIKASSYEEDRKCGIDMKYFGVPIDVTYNSSKNNCSHLGSYNFYGCMVEVKLRTGNSRVVFDEPVLVVEFSKVELPLVLDCTDEYGAEILEDAISIYWEYMDSLEPMYA